MTAPASGPATAASGKLNTAEATVFAESTTRLAELGRNFYGRGWLLGTSGNFSAVVRREPLRLAITPSGVDKGMLVPSQILQVDENGSVVDGSGKPSVETALHLAIVRLRGAAAVLHTHSVWNTLLSEAQAAKGGIALEGYEMLKGLEGVRTHEHREWLPIIENSQDMAALARAIEETLARFPKTHGLLLRGHGLYTWGNDLAEAKRHVEILEFLLEVVGRMRNRVQR
ncbi:MAG: methylthioribulose 1-phosphate dehydratase [Acidobacteria bacterium]|nr:methylthioribulose 1-phosphate dehydratase [Acidobacteriota bacterium]MCI0625879.1 methylthioribulose 1-phosphate dehydratase [Acidobacteriota bacterium]MCI0718155.1 methylthioribulose 1-phosphate dehydratase [Acidobacteriota bacterium]